MTAPVPMGDTYSMRPPVGATTVQRLIWSISFLRTDRSRSSTACLASSLALAVSTNPVSAFDRFVLGVIEQNLQLALSVLEGVPGLLQSELFRDRVGLRRVALHEHPVRPFEGILGTHRLVSANLISPLTDRVLRDEYALFVLGHSQSGYLTGDPGTVDISLRSTNDKLLRGEPLLQLGRIELANDVAFGDL